MVNDIPTQARRVAKRALTLDKALTHRAARHREEPAARAAGWLSEAADQPPLIIASAATIVVGAAARRGDLMRAGTRMLAAHLLATWGKTLIKHSVDRTRPKKAMAEGHHLAPGHSHDHDMNSFPSGHTAGAVAVARALSRDVPGAVLPSAAAVGLVAASQPAAGNHYLSDILVGAAIGWAAELAVSAVLDRAEAAIRRRPPSSADRPGRSSPT